MPTNASSLTSETLDQVANSLSEKGWIQLPGFIEPSLVEMLRADAQEKFNVGQFREARIGRGLDLKTEKKIRSDEISWFEPNSLTEPQQSLWDLLETLRSGLNERLFLGLHDFEAHYARYAPGASYGKHVDRFSTDDARTVSVVLYLNDKWSKADGGELALFPSGQANDAAPEIVSPEGGTFVCFMSADLEHEVRPSVSRPRQSIAIWFRKQKSPFR